MKEISAEELKAVQLGILNTVADYCKKHNITYYLAYGTLIGAIRHNGFIPWDDDIDIVMPRPDYEKFIRSFNNDFSTIQVVSIHSDPNYGFPFAKVHDTRTCLNETKYKQDIFGVFIDVFPIDSVKSKYQIYIIRLLNKFVHTKKANYSQRSLSKKIINFIGKIVLLPFSTHNILKTIDSYSQKHSYGSTPYAGSICDTVVGERAMIDIEVFKEAIQHEFEGKYYNIPIGYDKWLRRIYGDYMQLPPIEKRKTDHVFIAWWKG